MNELAVPVDEAVLRKMCGRYSKHGGNVFGSNEAVMCNSPHGIRILRLEEVEGCVGGTFGVVCEERCGLRGQRRNIYLDRNGREVEFKDRVVARR